MSSPQPDGATIEVIRNYLVSTAEQMRRTLVQTAFNPVIYEVLDFGISVYDSKLRLTAEAPGITHFTGANDYCLQKTVEHLGTDSLDPGDVVLVNYPYWNSAHTYDAMLFAPVFLPNASMPEAFVAIRAHWMDLGAKDAGYVLDSTDMHQEGLIFPGTKVVKRGQLDEEIVELIRFNSRMPDLVLGDLHAQIAAIRVGERRLLQIHEKFGVETVNAAIDVVIRMGEEAAREAVRNLPNGSWTAVDWLDDDGISRDPIRMEVVVTIDDDQFTADYSGSSPAVAGPVNVPFGATVGMARTVFKALTTPFEATNAGHLVPLDVVAPPGNLFHAVYPAPTFTLWTVLVAFELINKALAPAVDAIPASSGGDVPSFDVVGIHPDTGTLFTVSNNEGVGWGATSQHDGANAQQNPCTSVVRNTSLEVLEHKSPIIHERLELWADSGGAGQLRGGLGVRRDVRITAPIEILSMKKKTKTRPWALKGGHEPETNAMVVWPGTGKEVHARMERFDMAAGDRFHHFSAGGGGYGDPLQRDPELVVADVMDGYVTRDAGATIFGVMVGRDGTWKPTAARTAAERDLSRVEDSNDQGPLS